MLNGGEQESSFSHDLIIVSDFHIGAGFNQATRKYFHLENFFFDHTFFDFIEHFMAEADAEGRRFRLIFNGDIIDFLRIDYLGGRAPSFGGDLQEPLPVEKVRAAMAGHHGLMKPLGRWVVAGHDLILLPGNHDPEWARLEVREAFSAEMTRITESLMPGRGQQIVADRVKYLPWFYYEEGRIWVEHGSQYDPGNSRRNHLANWDKGSESDEGIWNQEEPFGSFFQKHLYSWFGNITFVVPSVRADGAYIRWLLLNRPRRVTKLIVRHLRFLWRVTREDKGIDTAAQARAERAHANLLNKLAAKHAMDRQLEQVDQLKLAPVGHRLRIINRLMWSVLVSFAATVAAVAMIITILYSGSVLLAETGLQLWMKSLIVGGANLGIICVIFMALTFWMLRSEGSADATEVLRLRGRAMQIGALVEVPIVVFGHTHSEDIIVGPHATYYNTGTWIPVFTGEQLRFRDRVCFPFLLVKDTHAEFLRWDHLLGRAVRFPLLEADHWSTDQQAPAASSNSALDS